MAVSASRFDGRVVVVTGAASGLGRATALLIGWLVALIPGLLALAWWRVMGGHLNAPEVLTVLAGYLTRGVLTIGVGAAADCCKRARCASALRLHAISSLTACDSISGFVANCSPCIKFISVVPCCTRTCP